MLHISAIAQLSHDQDTAASLKYIVAFYDVFIVALFQYLDLIFYQLIQFRVRHQILLRNSLDCKLTLFFFIVGFVHPGWYSFADLVSDFIVLYYYILKLFMIVHDIWITIDWLYII